jgi:hypothetical protein
MKNPFVSPKWDAPRRAWITTINRAGIVAIVLLTVASLMGAATQINIATQVRGVLAIVNGGTGTASTLTGLVRGSASAMTAAELSGDCATSGSNAVTCAKINGTSVPTNSAADQVLLTTASATGSYATIPDCRTGALQYNNSTHALACGTVLTGTFADAEVPTGLINGSNTSYTLAHTPSPAASLKIFKNGQELIAGGADYTLATATITMTTAPATGDTLIAFYRY